jgi:hypothetical protein
VAEFSSTKQKVVALFNGATKMVIDLPVQLLLLFSAIAFSFFI